MGKEIKVDDLQTILQQLVTDSVEKVKNMNPDDVKVAFEQIKTEIVSTIQQIDLEEIKNVFEQIKNDVVEKAKSVRSLVSADRIDNLENRIKKIEEKLDK
ncbi:MAG: hypothetical protein HQM11_05220 [SAR324 cluster bacterium]|nr:hypothetical protein [SAR324 cluster bacterium]